MTSINQARWNFGKQIVPGVLSGVSVGLLLNYIFKKKLTSLHYASLALAGAALSFSAYLIFSKNDSNLKNQNPEVPNKKEKTGSSTNSPPHSTTTPTQINSETLAHQFHISKEEMAQHLENMGFSAEDFDKTCKEEGLLAKLMPAYPEETPIETKTYVTAFSPNDRSCFFFLIQQAESFEQLPFDDTIFTHGETELVLEILCKGLIRGWFQDEEGKKRLQEKGNLLLNMRQKLTNIVCQHGSSEKSKHLLWEYVKIQSLLNTAFGIQDKNKKFTLPSYRYTITSENVKEVGKRSDFNNTTPAQFERLRNSHAGSITS